MSNTVNNETDTRARASRRYIVVRSGTKVEGASEVVTKKIPYGAIPKKSAGGSRKIPYGADRVGIELAKVEVVYGQCWLDYTQTDVEKRAYLRGVGTGFRLGQHSISRSHWFMYGATLCLIALGLGELIWGGQW